MGCLHRRWSIPSYPQLTTITGVSNSCSRCRDRERYTLYEDCRKHCTQVLYAHWDLVALIAQRLLKEKKLERQELELLWQTYGKKDGMDHEDDRKGGSGSQ